MTNHDILKTAVKQSSLDSGCLPEDFLSSQNKIVLSRPHPDARRYLELPFLCDFTSYGSNIVASVSPGLEELARDYISRYPPEHCFETPNLHVFMEKLASMGLNVCFMAEYFLPDMTRLKPLDCPYEVRLLEPEDFSGLYLPQWSNALCRARRHLDMLAIGAFDQGRLVGLAGCSADCDSMWQIGIDVLPGFRRQGVAGCLISRLALEIIGRGVVPFYCCAWSNVSSARSAIKSGFSPAWVQMTVKPTAFIDNMNRP